MPSGVAIVLATVTLTACGGKALGPATPDAGQTSALCAVATPAAPPPYAVQFRLLDDGASPVFLLDNCGGHDFGVSSCAGGFRDRLADRAFCACSCDNPSCGIVCGACAPDEATTIAPGDSTSLPWDGVATTIEQVKSGAGQCVSSKDLPAGRYRFSIAVYGSAADALARTGARMVSRDFELPAEGGVVDVPLAPSPDDLCDATPDAPVAACTGAEAHDVPCALTSGLTFSWNGGELATSYDNYAIAAPHAFTATRTFNIDPTRMPATCTAPIPRCSRDARVLTTGDLARALARPGVTSSFGAGTFGSQSNSPYLVVTAQNGDSVTIADPCTGCAHPLNDDLSALGGALVTLYQQELADPGCAALNPNTPSSP
jgi:hypothetical protein